MSQDRAHATGPVADCLSRARRAVAAQAFDEAIEAFIESLRLDPEATEIHAELRRVAVQRRGAGGADPTESDHALYRQATTALEKLLAAERLLSKHPEHLPYAQRVLRAAARGRYTQAATWIADLVFLAMNRSGKPAVEVYRSLKDTYLQIGQEERALLACKRILALAPDDPDARESAHILAARVEGTAKEPTESAIGAPAAHLGENETDKAPRETPPPEPSAAAESLPDTTAAAAAQLFFDRGGTAAASGNFDYALEMYLEGLRRAPEALAEGHLPLARIALQRQSQGGKKPSMVERAKGLRAKTPLDQMLSAESLWTKDPSHLPYAEAMLKAAVAGGYHRTGHWLANLIFQTNNALERPSLSTYLLLKDSYRRMEILDKSLAACQRAVALRPRDHALAEEYKNLSAELTMARGHYDQPGDFRKAIKDREKQELQYGQDRVVKTEDWRQRALDEARRVYDGDPDLPRNIQALAKALADLGSEEALEEAITLLQGAHERLQNFSYLDQAGQLRIKQIRQRLRAAEGAADPADTTVDALRTELLDTEFEHYRLCVENYPTDPRYKYEYALRLAQQGHHDEAIPLFQEAQRDPARRIPAMNQIGLAFLAKDWLADAVDVLTEAHRLLEGRDDGLAKEIRYNLARTYERQGAADKALEIYRKIAQTDFAYRDVSDRITQLRETGT